jgi:hypothetical protein
MDYFGLHFPAEVTLVGAELRLEVGPGSFLLGADTYGMTQLFTDTFFIDADGDGTLDTDLTFIAGDGTPPTTRWLRYRYAVGARLAGVRPGPRGRLGP